MKKISRFVHENGPYILLSHLAGSVIAFPRNYFLGRKFGVRKIKIGPRAYLRGLSSIQLGEDLSAEQGLWLEAITRYNNQTFSPKIVVGKHVRMSQFVHIAATHLVEIGDNVLMGSNVMITDHNHGQYSREHTSPDIAPTLRPLDHDRRVVVGRNVWLGNGVVVTPGSSIGEGVVIGANSVVVGRIPPYSMASGVPAIVRKTFDFKTEKWSAS